MALLCGKRKENLRGGPVPNQRARRPPRKLPLLSQLRKYGAYVIQGLHEMTGGLCIMVKNDVLFRVVGL